ncbi:alpha/beta fold hydrolase [Sporobolomyces koalae]|uniref:alpha/beta fold hydrolase n=1 Tax=Sporobolomyces koalae TaxID=500713 RepID=UPI003175EC71
MSTSSRRACSLFSRADGYVFGYKVLSRELVPHRTPLVLVTGLSAVGLIDWFPLASLLAKERPVLVFDNRGIGSSTIPHKRKDEPYTIEDMAQDVVELVKHLGWNRIDILGFSMGGMIVQQLLTNEKRLPFRIEHVVLTATSAKRAHSDLLKAIPQPQDGAREGGGEMTREAKRKLVEPFTNVNYSPDFIKNPKNRPLLDRRIDESIDSRRPARTVQQQIAGYDVRKKLGSIPSHVPVLVLHGTLDRSVYYTEAKYILEGIRHAKLLTFEGVGHMWYDYYTPEYWVRLLSVFLNDPRGGDVSALVPPAVPSHARL